MFKTSLASSVLLVTANSKSNGGGLEVQDGFNFDITLIDEDTV